MDIADETQPFVGGVLATNVRGMTARREPAGPTANGNGRRRLSLSAGTVVDASPEGALRAAAAAAFDGFGIRWNPALTPAAGLPALRRRIEASGVSLVDLEVVRLGPAVPLSDHRPWVDTAIELGAQFLLVVSHHADPGRTRDELAALARWCAADDVSVALEFMRFTAVPTFRAASAAVRAVDAPNLSVLVDALHLIRGGETAADLHVPDAGPIGYIQLCDAPLALPPGAADDLEVLAHEARHCRLFPGDGELPLADLVRATPMNRTCAVEVQSDRWREVDVMERAQQAMDSARRLLDRIDGDPEGSIT